jgi:hypothetical protein
VKRSTANTIQRVMLKALRMSMSRSGESVQMIGVVTASIAAWFVGRNEEAADDSVVAEIRALREQVGQLLEQRSPEQRPADQGNRLAGP